MKLSNTIKSTLKSLMAFIILLSVGIVDVHAKDVHTKPFQINNSGDLIYKSYEIGSGQLEPIPVSAQNLCLAIAVYGEARNQDIMGQEAVVHVIDYRLSKRVLFYRNNVCNVILQKHQFEFTDKNPLLNHYLHKLRQGIIPEIDETKLDMNAFNKALYVVDSVNSRTDYLSKMGFKADHFLRKDMKSKPKWTDKLHLVGYIGDHEFYLANN